MNYKSEEALAKVRELSAEERRNNIVPVDIQSEMAVQIPPLYYWEDVFESKSQLMTMAFDFKGMKFGYSYPIEDENLVRKEMLRRKLFARMKETMDVMVHHGMKVLDADGNIDPRKVNDEEAIRFKYDKRWDKKVAAFNQLVKVFPITKKKAIKLGLIDAPKNA